MKNIHIIPTDKPSRLWLTKLGNLTRCHDIKPIKEALGNNVNIYITNGEEIKEGDWILKDGKPIRKSGRIKHYAISEPKIILTTDSQLIADGVQAIDDEFLEWFVKNPSCEKIEVEQTFVTYSGLGYLEYAVLDSNFKVIEINTTVPQTSYYLGKTTILNTYEYVINYKIIIPKEEAKQKDKIKEIVNHFKDNKPNNWEQEESIRQTFIDETKEKLWTEKESADCGFSEEYVFWLEQKLIESLKNKK